MAAVGRVASAWAHFEATLDLLSIARARISQEIGYCFTSQVIGPARKLDAYIAITRLRGGDRFMGDLEGLGKDTVVLAERRNRVVHDPWVSLQGKEQLSRFDVTARRILRMRHIDVPTDDILKLLEEINAHRHRLIELDFRISAALEK